MSIFWSQKLIITAIVFANLSLLAITTQAQTSIWRCRGVIDNPSRYARFLEEFEFYDGDGVVQVYGYEGQRRYFKREYYFSVENDKIIIITNSRPMILDKEARELITVETERDRRRGYTSVIRCNII